METQAQPQVYFGDWALDAVRWHGMQGREGMAHDFETHLPEDIEVLFAEYTQESYQGDALVLFRQGGKVYEVHASHCSCYGLEDQWEPEVANLEELVNRNSKWPMAETDEGQARLAELLPQLLAEQQAQQAA